MITNIKIISGGQSGVDRAALDFALENEFPCGGWCPKGRKAEDGRISDKYPLQETGTYLYVVRTKLNVDSSDATLILFAGELGNGSAFTAEYALTKKKPLLIANMTNKNAHKNVADWLRSNEIDILNIAGPRESTSPGIYQLSLDFLEKVLKDGAGH